jgi:hypothetical protein
MMKGLGEIGVESEAAARALDGLRETPVRGKEALIEYAKTAGQLGIIGGERGKEAGIAGGMARVITARGGEPSDIDEMRKVAESLVRIRQVTGKAPTESLRAMEMLFEKMPKEFRSKFSTKMMESIAAAGTMGGPGATNFIIDFLRRSVTQRAGLEARGIGDIITEEGLDISALERLRDEAKKLGSGDFRLGMKAMGLGSDEAAEGAIRLVEKLDRLSAAQDKLGRVSVDLAQLQRDNATMGEAFRMNLSKIKGILTAPFAKAPHMITEGLAEASKTTVGASAIVAGGGILSALMMGIGLRGVGKLMGGGAMGGIAGGIARAGAIEATMGREVVPVYVTNAAEMGSGKLMAGSLASTFISLGKAMGAGIAFMIGREIGKYFGLEQKGKELADVMLDKTGRVGQMLELGTDITRRAITGQDQVVPKLSRPWENQGIPESIKRPQEIKLKIEDHTGKLQPKGNPPRGMDFINMRTFR